MIPAKESWRYALLKAMLPRIRQKADMLASMELSGDEKRKADAVMDAALALEEALQIIERY